MSANAWGRCVRQHPKARSIAYFVLGQGAWFVCVLGIAHQQPVWGAALVVGLTLLHLAWVPQPGREACFLAAVTLMGAAWETVMVNTGLMTYATPPQPAGWAPWWLVALWLLLALQVNVLLGWLQGRWLLAAALGALGGSMSFRGGAALGAVQFSDTSTALLTLAAGWLFLMPALLMLARRWNGVEPANISP